MANIIKIDDNFKDAILAYRDLNNMDYPFRYEEIATSADLMFNKETGRVWVEDTTHETKPRKLKSAEVRLSNLIKESGDYFTYDDVKWRIEENFPDTYYDFPPDKEPVYKTGYLIGEVQYKMPVGVVLEKYDNDAFNAGVQEIQCVYSLDWKDAELDGVGENEGMGLMNHVLPICSNLEDALSILSYHFFQPELHSVRFEKGKLVCYFSRYEVQEVTIREYSGDYEKYTADGAIVTDNHNWVEVADTFPAQVCSAIYDNMTQQVYFSSWNTHYVYSLKPIDKTIYQRDSFVANGYVDWKTQEHKYNFVVSDGERADIYEPERQPCRSEEVLKLTVNFFKYIQNKEDFPLFNHVGTVSEETVKEMNTNYNRAYNRGESVRKIAMGNLGTLEEEQKIAPKLQQAYDLLKPQEEQTEEHKAPVRHR